MVSVYGCAAGIAVALFSWVCSESINHWWVFLSMVMKVRRLSCYLGWLVSLGTCHTLVSGAQPPHSLHTGISLGFKGVYEIFLMLVSCRTFIFSVILLLTNWLSIFHLYRWFTVWFVTMWSLQLVPTSAAANMPLALLRGSIQMYAAASTVDHYH